MENIVIVEKLCDKLQESDRPTDLGVAIALRVILDENITLSEKAEELAKNVLDYKKINNTLSRACNNLLTDKRELKEANNILTIEIEQANALINMYKSKAPVITQNFGRGMRMQLSKESRKKVWQEYYKGIKPQQISIQFPANVPTVNISEEEKQKSIYYKSAKRRAKKVWGHLETSTLSKELTKPIVNWGFVFHLMPGERLKYAHIEAACMPKCYGGLGIAVGMKLEDWVDSQTKTKI